MPNNKPATKKDVVNIVEKAFDKFSSKVLAPSFVKVEKRITGAESRLNKRIDDLNEEVKDESKKLQREIKENRKSINHLATNTPTRKEFGELKSRVDHHHPTN